MEDPGFLKRHKIKRSAMRADIFCFAIPAMTVLVVGLYFCTQSGLSGFWGIAWNLITHPQQLARIIHDLVGANVRVRRMEF